MIEVLNPGLYSTIQDLGRIGYRKFGVPVSGAMDQYSANLANHILGNSKAAPVIELTITGPTLKFNKSCMVAITGAEFKPTLNGSVIENNSVISIDNNSVLAFGSAEKGMRAYLSIAGGFESEMVMQSASYYLNITQNSRLKKGDKLFFNENIRLVEGTKKILPANQTSFEESKILTYKGPEFYLLPPRVQDKLLSEDYKILSQSNRMGYRLGGGEALSAKEIITSPVQPGTVQLTPSGQLIILGRDAQTTGGYARVLQLTQQAQNNLAQLQFGRTVNFELSDYAV